MHIFISSIPNHAPFQDTALAPALLQPHKINCLMSFLTARYQNSCSLQYCTSCRKWKAYSEGNICQNVPQSHGVRENLIHGVQTYNSFRHSANDLIRYLFVIRHTGSLVRNKHVPNSLFHKTPVSGQYVKQSSAPSSSSSCCSPLPLAAAALTTITTTTTNNQKHLHLTGTTLLSVCHYLPEEQSQGASSFWLLVFACYSLQLQWLLLLWGARLWLFKCSCGLGLNDNTSSAWHTGDGNVALTIFTFNCCKKLDTTYIIARTNNARLP